MEREALNTEMYLESLRYYRRLISVISRGERTGYALRKVQWWCLLDTQIAPLNDVGRVL